MATTQSNSQKRAGAFKQLKADNNGVHPGRAMRTVYVAESIESYGKNFFPTLESRTTIAGGAPDGDYVKIGKARNASIARIHLFSDGAKGLSMRHADLTLNLPEEVINAMVIVNACVANLSRLRHEASVLRIHDGGKSFDDIVNVDIGGTYSPAKIYPAYFAAKSAKTRAIKKLAVAIATHPVIRIRFEVVDAIKRFLLASQTDVRNFKSFMRLCKTVQSQWLAVNRNPKDLHSLVVLWTTRFQISEAAKHANSKLSRDQVSADMEATRRIAALWGFKQAAFAREEEKRLGAFSADDVLLELISELETKRDAETHLATLNLMLEAVPEAPDPVVASSLNGNNGEATNEDDVAELTILLAFCTTFFGVDLGMLRSNCDNLHEGYANFTRSLAPKFEENPNKETMDYLIQCYGAGNQWALEFGDSCGVSILFTIVDGRYHYYLEQTPGRELLRFKDVKIVTLGDVNFKITSDLNGLNGEATNEDDRHEFYAVFLLILCQIATAFVDPGQIPCDQVKSTYRALSRQYHPDKGGSHDDMVKLNNWYDRMQKLCGTDRKSPPPRDDPPPPPPQDDPPTFSQQFISILISIILFVQSSNIFVRFIILYVYLRCYIWYYNFMSRLTVSIIDMTIGRLVRRLFWSKKRLAARDLAERKSQLNGANGEVTGKDDVKKDKERKKFNDRKKNRAPKEIVAGKAPTGPPVEGGEVPPLNIPKPFVAVAAFTGICDQPALGLDGKLARVRSMNGELVCFNHDGTSMNAQVAREDNVEYYLPGIYVFNPDAPLTFMVPSFVLMDWSVNGEVCKRWVCLKALESLKTQFLNPQLDERNVNAMLAYLQKFFPTLGPVYTANVQDCYSAELTALRGDVFGRASLRHLKVGAPNMVKMDVAESIARPSSLLPKSTNLGNTFHSWGVPNDLEDLTDNDNFQILSMKGCQLREGHKTLVDFNTLTVYPKLYRTWFFRLAAPSVDHQFVQYDRSGENATRATARMYKSRPDEDILVSNQHCVFSFLDYDKTLDVHVSNKYKDEAGFDRFHESLEWADIENLRWSDTDPRTLAYVQHRYRLLIEDVAEDYFGFWFFFLRRFAEIFWDIGVFIAGLFIASVARQWYVEQPSPKKKLYETWYALLGWYYGVYAAFDCRPEAKVKIEFGKPGKFARLYVSYSECILQAGWIYGFLKKALCGTYSDFIAHDFPFFHDIYYSKRSDVFTFDTPGFYSRSFSDDSEDVIVIPGLGSWRIASDISSCDASMRSGLFRMSARLFSTIGASHLVASVFAPFTCAIVLYNPNNSKESYKLKPRDVFMGSGSPDTTHMNNLYNYGVKSAVYNEICLAFNLNRRNPNAEPISEENAERVLLECYRRGARAMGAITTQKVCYSVEHSDFLKEVTFREPTGYVVSLALGPMLRGLGGVDGDIVSNQIGVSNADFRRMDDTDKMEAFVGGVVKGYCNEPSNIILDALRNRFVKGNIIATKHFSNVQRSSLRVSTHSLISRYGGTEAEWNILASEISNLALGDYIASPILARIYEVDYSLAPA